MGFLKRHWWLAATLGAMVVLSGVATALWTSYRGRRAGRVAVLKRSEATLQQGKQYYNRGVAKKLEGTTKVREAELKKIVDYLRRQSKWDPLIPSIFPQYGNEAQVFEFKYKYKEKIKAFMDLLGAVDPAPEGGADILKATMFSRIAAFHKARWIDENVLPDSPDKVMRDLRESQDDLWLMEDIVQAIKRTNDLYFGTMEIEPDAQTVSRAVIKELHGIELGAEKVELSRYSGTGRSRRYVFLGEESDPDAGVLTSDPPEDVEGRAQTLTGRASDNSGGRYWVLPFRVTVIADAGNYAELLRQLTGTRSFITIINLKYEVIPETDNSYRNYSLMQPKKATRIELYGERPLARVTLWGESLVFRTPGARPTTAPPTKTDDE